MLRETTMSTTVLTAQHVTNASGAVALASTSTSLGVAKITNVAPPEGAEQLIDKAHLLITTADMIGICSVTVLVLSFLWNVHATRKRTKREIAKAMLDERFYALRKSEHELELARFKAECTGVIEDKA